MLSMHIATWPVSLESRTALFGLQLLGWVFRLDAVTGAHDEDASWVVTAGLGSGTRRCTGPTPEAAVAPLLAVLAEHEVMEPGWHVVARRPGERYPKDVATVSDREDAMVRGMIMQGRHVGAEVFVVRFSPAPIRMTQILSTWPSALPAPEPVRSDPPDG